MEQLPAIDASYQPGMLNGLLLCSAPACEAIEDNPWVDVFSKPLAECEGIRWNRSTSWTSPYFINLTVSALPRNILFSPGIIFSPPPKKCQLTPLVLQQKQEKAKNLRNLFLSAKAEKLKAINEKVIKM